MESTRHSSWYVNCSQILNSRANEKVVQGQQKSNRAEHFKYMESEFVWYFKSFI